MKNQNITETVEPIEVDTPITFAEKVKVTPRHIINLAHRGDIPSFRVGKNIRIPTVAALKALGVIS